MNRKVYTHFKSRLEQPRYPEAAQRPNTTDQNLMLLRACSCLGWFAAHPLLQQQRDSDAAYLKKTKGGRPRRDCSSDGSLLRCVVVPLQLLF